MENLNLDPVKTAVLSLDIQKGVVRKTTMYRERNVGQAARSVLEAARKTSMLVVHVVIDYRPSFFPLRNKLWDQYCPFGSSPSTYWPYIVLTASQLRLMWAAAAWASRQTRCSGFSRKIPCPPEAVKSASIACTSKRVQKV